MMQESIAKAAARTDLTVGEAASAMHMMMTGRATDAQVGAFLTAMSMKGGETTAEIAACAGGVLREHAASISRRWRAPSLIPAAPAGGICGGAPLISAQRLRLLPPVPVFLLSSMETGV